MNRLRMGLVQLNGCTGCLSRVISCILTEDILRVADISYCPVVKDTPPDSLDLTFVEGAVSIRAEEEYLKKIRTTSKTLVAVGTCSIFGGIMSLSRNMNVKAIAEAAIPDYYLTGCPPSKSQIDDFLFKAITGEIYVQPQKNVCSECPFKPEELSFPLTIRKFYPESPLKRCLLETQTLCLGPVTRAGCDAMCISFNMPCEGCNGPPEGNFNSALANFFSILNLNDEMGLCDELFFRFHRCNLRS